MIMIRKGIPFTNTTRDTHRAYSPDSVAELQTRSIDPSKNKKINLSNLYIQPDSSPRILSGYVSAQDYLNCWPLHTDFTPVAITYFDGKPNSVLQDSPPLVHDDELMLYRADRVHLTKLHCSPNATDWMKQFPTPAQGVGFHQIMSSI